MPTVNAKKEKKASKGKKKKQSKKSKTGTKTSSTSKSITPLKETKKKSKSTVKAKKSTPQRKLSKKKTLKSGKSSTDTKHSVTSSTVSGPTKKERRRCAILSRHFGRKSKTRSTTPSSQKRAAASGSKSVQASSNVKTPKSKNNISKDKGKKKAKKTKKAKVKSKSKSVTPSTSSAATSFNSTSQPTTPSKDEEPKSHDTNQQKKTKAATRKKDSTPKISTTKPSVKTEQHNETTTPVHSKDDNAQRLEVINPAVPPEKPGTDPKNEQMSKNQCNVFVSKSEEREAQMMACSNWSLMTTSRIQPNRIILIMRSAERVDRVFGRDWILTEAPHGVLTPTDLNIPSNFTTTQLLNTGVLLDNSPITIMGKYSTVLVARAIFNRGLTPKLVVCSPALRAVQTADELAKFLHAKLAIEPGLVEPLSWYRNPGKETLDFRIDELSKYYMINSEDYSQIISMESIMRLYATESETQGISRIDFVLRSLAGEQRKQPLVVVGHAITLATGVALASQITSLEWQMGEQMSDENNVDQVNLGLRFPPGCVIAITQTNKGPPFRYELTPNILPPLSYGEMYTNQPDLEA